MSSSEPGAVCDPPITRARRTRCARAYASVGEQVAVLKEVFGEYHDPGYF